MIHRSYEEKAFDALQNDNVRLHQKVSELEDRIAYMLEDGDREKKEIKNALKEANEIMKLYYEKKWCLDDIIRFWRTKHNRLINTKPHPKGEKPE